jgi:hypothetical protein
LIPVVGNTHPFYGAYRPCGFVRPLSGALALASTWFFPLSSLPNSRVLPWLALGALSRLPPLSRRSADLARVWRFSVSDKLRYSVLELQVSGLLIFPRINIIAQTLDKTIDLSYTTSND